MHTVSVSGKYDANSSVGPISQHLVLFILLTFYLNYLPLWSVSDDQKLERKKTEKNKAKQTFLFKTRFELRDHPFTTGRIATEVIVISVSVFFFTFCLGRTFCVQPRHPRWRSFHFPHWKNSSGKFHRFHFFRFNVYVKPVVLQSSGTEICFRLSFTDAPKNKISLCLKRRFDVGGCLITLDWRCKQGVLNWENISNYLHLCNMFIYLFIHVFFHLFSHLLACNLTLCSFIANEILLHFLLFCHLVSLWLHFWETGLWSVFTTDRAVHSSF